MKRFRLPLILVVLFSLVAVTATFARGATTNVSEIYCDEVNVATTNLEYDCIPEPDHCDEEYVGNDEFPQDDCAPPVVASAPKVANLDCKFVGYTVISPTVREVLYKGNCDGGKIVYGAPPHMTLDLVTVEGNAYETLADGQVVKKGFLHVPASVDETGWLYLTSTTPSSTDFIEVLYP